MSEYEDAKESKLIRNLRKENIKLRRELSQVKKRNSRIENDFAKFVADKEEEAEYETIEITDKKVRFTCPTCGAYEVNTFLLGDVPYYKCLDCNSKGKV